MCGGDKRTRLICLKDGDSGILKLQPFGDKCKEDELCWPLWRYDSWFEGSDKTECSKGKPPVGYQDGQWGCDNSGAE